VIAGLERDVERGAFRGGAGVLQRDHLGVIGAGFFVMTGRDELSALHDGGADMGIRRGLAAARVDQRDVHPALVFELPGRERV